MGDVQLLREALSGMLGVFNIEGEPDPLKAFYAIEKALHALDQTGGSHAQG